MALWKSRVRVPPGPPKTLRESGVFFVCQKRGLLLVFLCAHFQEETMSGMQCLSVFLCVPNPDLWEDGCDKYCANGCYINHRCIGDGCMCWEQGRRQSDRPLVKAALAAKQKAREQGVSKEPEDCEMDTGDWEPPRRSNKTILLLALVGVVLVILCTGGVWSFWAYVVPTSWQQALVEERCP
jgi:hypothetical protein